ncbi:MAG: YdeI/OmpD-associated family protein [Flavobacteriales bacterium]|nr:YdeI/OmpD-associated family protein [Flavobacteriales bacterium]
MSKVDKQAAEKVDYYIQNQNPNFQEILRPLRKVILDTDKRILEDWKWNAPNYNLEGLLTWMVAFKDHVGLNFYKGAGIEDKYDLFEQKGTEGKNNRIIRLSNIDDLNKEAIEYYVSEAIKINESGIKLDSKRKEISVPVELIQLFNKYPKAKLFYETLAPSKRRDYNEWISTAKRETTKQKRLEQTIEKLLAKESLHQKYER